MRPLGLLLASVLIAAPAHAALANDAARAYHAARTSYYALKADEDAQRFRHNWERVISAFRSVHADHPKSDEAPRALFTTASLTHDLYEISRRSADADEACARYRQVHDEFPKSSLADDALYEAARLYRRRGRNEKARDSLALLIAEHAKGDMAARARRMQQDLGSSTNSKALTRRFKVVVDAGHGGRDSGAIGVGGLAEKRVNLEIARRIARLLRNRGVDVIMTRDDDSTVSLDTRAERANTASADLMVSVHANAARQKTAHGVETYYLDVTHSRYAKRLAHRENAGSEQGVKLILADLATKVSTRESRELADAIQRRLVQALRTVNSKVRDLGAKPAMLHVLMHARCPAVLVESGFVTNPREASLLGRADYQNAVAEAVADGVLAQLEPTSISQNLAR